MKIITLRLADEAYEAVKNHADAEDMRRRCRAHERWMSSSPDMVAWAEAWADQNLDELVR